MTHIDHGSWVLYQPNPVPEGAPAYTLFARRESDGADWYEYVRTFNPATVKFAANMREEYGSYVVGPATYDATTIFPAGFIVVEIPDYAGSDPSADFTNKAYDPATDSFSDVVRPPARMAAIADLEVRVAKLEARMGDK